MNKDKALTRLGQMDDLVKLMTIDRFMLLSDPGTGKTPPACVFMWWLWSEKKKRTVWVMPKTLLEKNREEALDWSEFQSDEVMIYYGGPIRTDPKVLIMTFERWRRSWRQLLEWFPDIDALVVDEYQLGYKSNDSKRTQELYKAMEKIRHFVPMTGTLIAGRLDTAYSAIHIIESRYYSGHANFLAIHALTDEWGKVLAWVNHERLCKILLAHGSSRSFKDVFGEENKVLQVETVDMSPKQRAIYDKFEKDALLELEDRFVDGSLPGVNAIRCRQIMAHPEQLNLPIEWDVKGKPVAYKSYNLTDGELTGKDERLEIHLQDHLVSKKPLAIFGVFEIEIERVAARCRKLGMRVGVIHGKVPGHIRAQHDRDMRAGKLDVIVATCATAGVGLNWPDLDHMIFMSIDYQDDHFLQAYRRAMRDVRATPLWLTVLEYRKSIDQPIMGIVERKSRDANRVDSNRQVISFRGTKTPDKDCDNQSLSPPQALGSAEQKPTLAALMRK